MEISNAQRKISQSITFKAILIGVMSLLLLIPGAMLENLIQERKTRSEETIAKINEKWSNAQTINGPYLIVPYQTKVVNEKKNISVEKHVIIITPEQLNIKVKLTPEERYYGIYKAILYKSILQFSGNFKKPELQLPPNSNIAWNEAQVRLGITDLRGLSSNPDIVFCNKHYDGLAGGSNDAIGQGIVITLKNSAIESANILPFSCSLKLNGSSNINFIPAGKTTKTEMAGNWSAPSFMGNFTPEYKITKEGFTATWNVLHFNRNISEYWTDKEVKSIISTSFGVNLIDTVDHYQQNMRSAKYEFMFVALTFVIFFFVEILTKKKIHPIQYLLVGVALVLFYSLLLSISEHIGFITAYIIASIATIGLIVAYAYSIFRNKTHSVVLAAFLTVLYIFLFVVLQLEDIALMIGSIGLFVILGIIMFVSRKINWYKQQEEDKDLSINNNQIS